LCTAIQNLSECIAIIRNQLNTKHLNAKYPNAPKTCSASKLKHLKSSILHFLSGISTIGRQTWFPWTASSRLPCLGRAGVSTSAPPASSSSQAASPDPSTQPSSLPAILRYSQQGCFATPFNPTQLTASDTYLAIHSKLTSPSSLLSILSYSQQAQITQL